MLVDVAAADLRRAVTKWKSRRVTALSGTHARIWGLFGLYPKIVLLKFWLANILLKLFLAHKLANIGLKNELELVVKH
jgi:hypothetical protein